MWQFVLGVIVGLATPLVLWEVQQWDYWKREIRQWWKELFYD